MQKHNVNRHLEPGTPSWWDNYEATAPLVHEHEMPVPLYTSVGQHVYRDLRLVSVCPNSRVARDMARDLNEVA